MVAYHLGEEVPRRAAESQPPADGGHGVGAHSLVVEELGVAVRPDRSGFGLAAVLESPGALPQHRAEGD